MRTARAARALPPRFLSPGGTSGHGEDDATDGEPRRAPQRRNRRQARSARVSIRKKKKIGTEGERERSKVNGEGLNRQQNLALEGFGHGLDMEDAHASSTCATEKEGDESDSKSTLVQVLKITTKSLASFFFSDF